MTAKKARPKSWAARHEADRIPGPLGDAVTAFRQKAELHLNSPDRALVDFAFGPGKDRPGAREVRIVSYATRGQSANGKPVDTDAEAGEDEAPGADSETI